MRRIIKAATKKRFLPEPDREKGRMPKAAQGKAPVWQTKIRFRLLSQQCGALSKKFAAELSERAAEKIPPRSAFRTH